MELLPYVKLEIVAMNDDVYRLASAIVRSARTGELGDGKIFISPVEDAVRIRDSEQGGNAV